MVITELQDDQVFVFGSNLEGIHGAGAARDAMKWGARYGFPMGRQGQTYAIVTKDLRNGSFVGWDMVASQLETLDWYASLFPDLQFLLTPIGTGLAGGSLEELDRVAKETILSDNIIFTWRE